MMLQFETFKINGGKRALFLVNTERYDIAIGFRTLIKYLGE